MIKPVLKTLSLSFVTLAAFAAPLTAGQGAHPHKAAMAIEPARFVCLTQAEINRGWEYQQRQLERRLAEKEAEGLAVPGAIISPPFEAFLPYRTDVPPIAAARKAAKGERGQSAPRRSVTNRS